MKHSEHKSPPGPIIKTKAWATYVADMAKLGMTVEHGIATHEIFGVELRRSNREFAS
tara:strand:- start:3763 stop:3933 length:171 start_codon:yes stop_codon:yes gene_type:complete